MVLVVVVEVEVVDVVVVAEVVVNQEPLRDKKVLFAVLKTLAMASYCHLDPYKRRRRPLPPPPPGPRPGSSPSPPRPPGGTGRRR